MEASSVVDTSGQKQAARQMLKTRNTSGQPVEVAELKDLYRKAKGVRSRFEPEWYMNLAFYIGQQWVFWNRGRLDKPFLADWRETITDNRILPIVSSRTARKVKNRPAFVATPFTADEADIDAAKITEKVLDQDWVNLDLQAKLYQAQLFAEICGAGFWKIYWDSTKGDAAEFVYGADDQPMTQQNGSPVKAEMFGGDLPEGLQTKELATGEVCVDVLSPFELYPDPLATSLAECEWVIEEKVRSQDYLTKRYGDKAASLTPDAEAPIGPVESRLFSSSVYSTGGADQYKGIKVFEYWSRPSTDYPQGKRCVWSQDQILLEEDAPFDSMPYVMFSGVRVPSRIWPTSVTTQLRGPQVELNKLESQIAENGERIGNPALMKSRQANVTYTGVPGEEILFDSTVPDAMPSYLQPPEVPLYLRERVDRIQESMTEISGIHEVSKASVPSGVTAASAINLLQEADDTRLGPEIQDMETQLGQAGTKIVRLRAQFNSDERLIRIAGEDGNWDIEGYRGEMMGENTNVEVQAGSAMPRSKAAKQAAMLEVLQLAFQYGVELDPRDLRRFFKDYEVAALERLFDTITVDETQCNREERLMMKGEALPTNSWDDDPFHIQHHEDQQKTDRYERLDPAIKGVFQIHLDAHRERAVQAVNQQMQALSPPVAPPGMQGQMTTPEGGLAT